MRASTGRRRGDWGSFISSGREKHRFPWRSRLQFNLSERQRQILQENASDHRAVFVPLADDCAHLARLHDRSGRGSIRFHLKAELLPGITKVAGYKGSYLLRRRCGKEIEFITVMLWDSLEALREFPGRDYEQAIVPVERRKLLSHYDERSAHYEILLHPAARDVLSSA